VSEKSDILASETEDFLFLRTLYDLTGGDIKESTSFQQIKKATKFEDSKLIELIKLLISESKIQAVGVRDLFQLTPQGKHFVEFILEGPPQSNIKLSKYSIFFSHSHENETVAKALKKYFHDLFSNEIHVFISGDPNNIPAGQDWFTTIIDEIKECNCMIILCSPDSIERKWIHFEAGAAVILGKKIIPICFAGLTAGELPSPLSYIRSQAIDADDGERLRTHFEILIHEIAGLTSGNGPMLDVLRSAFYEELQLAHPKNQKLNAVVFKSF
jgi:hypothetical protein